jgi:hypothetical protein
MIEVKPTNNTTNIEQQQTTNVEATANTKYCVLANETLKNNNTLIANRLIKISPEKFITNIDYFKDICELDENEIVKHIEHLLAKCSKNKIQEWLEMKFKLPTQDTLYNPVTYSVFSAKVDLAKQLLKSFNKNKRNILENLTTKKEFCNQFEQARQCTEFIFYCTVVDAVLTRSLNYHDIKLTIELIKFYEKNNYINLTTYYSLIDNSIKNNQINMLQAILEIFYEYKGESCRAYYDCYNEENRILDSVKLAINNDNIPALKLLIDNRLKLFNSKDNLTGVTIRALQSNNLDIIKLILPHYGNLNAPICKDMCEYFSFLQDVTKIPLAERHRNTIRYRDIYYKTYTNLLDQAVQYCNATIVLWLIKNGAKALSITPNMLNNSKTIPNPLHIAIFLNKPKIVAILLATKVANFNDKAWFLNNNGLSSITAKDYIFKVNEYTNISEIISMVNQPLSLSFFSEFTAINHHLQNNSLNKLEYYKKLYKLPTQII